jgi:hypothetical protein
MSEMYLKMQSKVQTPDLRFRFRVRDPDGNRENNLRLYANLQKSGGLSIQRDKKRCTGISENGKQKYQK